MTSSKTIRIFLFAASIVFHTSMNAQTAVRSLITNATAPELEKSSSTFKNEIHSKALRHFYRNFKVNGQENWNKLDNGYQADFLDEGIKQRVFYNKKGQWSCSIKDYSETRIPSDIADQVKTPSPFYRISHVSELQFPNSKAYIVHIKDGIHYKILRLVDGEIQLLHDYLDLTTNPVLIR